MSIKLQENYQKLKGENYKANELFLHWACDKNLTPGWSLYLLQSLEERNLDELAKKLKIGYHYIRNSVLKYWYKLKV